MSHDNGLTYTTRQATDERPYPTYRAQDFTTVINASAGNCGLNRDGRKFSLKSIRVMKTAGSASSGMTSDEVSRVMGWSKGSRSAEAYCQILRAVDKPLPTVTPQQFQALRQAKLYKMDQWVDQTQLCPRTSDT